MPVRYFPGVQHERRVAGIAKRGEAIFRDRATLAEKLLASLEEIDEVEAARLWEDKAERRLQAYRSGIAKAVSARSVHRKAEKLLR